MEILTAAADLAVEEGLTRITARSVAERVGVRAGLVIHYFGAVDDLIAEAFALAAARERGRILSRAGRLGSSVSRMRFILESYTSPSWDPVGLLWLDAWREARERPALRCSVLEQMELDVDSFRALIEEGVAEGVFRVDDTEGAAIRILGVLDGQVAASAVRVALTQSRLDFSVLGRMVFALAEDELGLEAGALRLS